MTEDTDVEVYCGAQLRVIAVRDGSGRCHGEEFLRTLRAKHPRAYTELKVRIQRLADTGELRNTEQFRRIQGAGEPPVYEIKAHDGPGWRLYAIRDGAAWYVTHGCKKPKDKQVANEAERARRIYRGKA